MFICVFINDHYQRSLNTDGYRYKGKVTEYGQCPNTDALSISEIINPTKKCVMKIKYS